MLLRPLENGHCFPFSHLLCSCLPDYSLLALLPILAGLILSHVTPYTSPSKVEPAMMTLVARYITQKSIPLLLKTPRLQSHVISQFRTAALGSQPIPVSEFTSLTSPFILFSHKCHWLGCFSPNIQILHAFPFRCILLAPSPGMVTSEPLRSELNGHPPSPITHSLIQSTTYRQIIPQLCHELSPPPDGVP